MDDALIHRWLNDGAKPPATTHDAVRRATVGQRVHGGVYRLWLAYLKAAKRHRALGYVRRPAWFLYNLAYRLSGQKLRDVEEFHADDRLELSRYRALAHSVVRELEHQGGYIDVEEFTAALRVVINSGASVSLRSIRLERRA